MGRDSEFMCFLAFLTIAGIVVTLLVKASNASIKNRGFNKAFDHLAKRYGGKSYSGGWFHSPTLRFKYRGATAIFNISSQRDTQLQIAWPEQQFYLEVLPKDAPAPAKLPGGSQPISLDNAGQLDTMVRAWTNRPSLVRSIGVDAVQWQIEKLYSFYEQAATRILWRDGRLLIQKDGTIRLQEDLDEFIRLGLELYDQAILTQTRGIDFVDSDVVKPLEDAMCQVCGEQIAEELVFCKRCKTPHHRECWQYNGCCTTFGCGEKVFLFPDQGHGGGQPNDNRRHFKPR